jgi:hypothetical protein
VNTIRALSEEEITRLKAYRRASYRAHGVVDKFWGVRFTATMGGPSGNVVNGLPDESFITLLTAIRLVYLQKEPAHFERTVKTLRRILPKEFGDALDVIAGNWESSRGPRGIVFRGPTVSMSIWEALDSLINGIVFHQDEQHAVKARLLEQVSPLSDAPLQLTAFLMGQTMVQLDSLVAHALGEPPLRRGPTIDLAALSTVAQSDAD